MKGPLRFLLARDPCCLLDHHVLEYSATPINGSTVGLSFNVTLSENPSDRLVLIPFQYSKGESHSTYNYFIPHPCNKDLLQEDLETGLMDYIPVLLLPTCVTLDMLLNLHLPHVPMKK
jgi:hypothetical protein